MTDRLEHSSQTLIADPLEPSINYREQVDTIEVVILKAEEDGVVDDNEAEQIKTMAAFVGQGIIEATTKITGQDTDEVTALRGMREGIRVLGHAIDDLEKHGMPVADRVHRSHHDLIKDADRLQLQLIRSRRQVQMPQNPVLRGIRGFAAFCLDM